MDIAAISVAIWMMVGGFGNVRMPVLVQVDSACDTPSGHARHSQLLPREQKKRQRHHSWRSRPSREDMELFGMFDTTLMSISFPSSCFNR